MGITTIATLTSGNWFGNPLVGFVFDEQYFGIPAKHFVDLVIIDNNTQLYGTAVSQKHTFINFILTVNEDVVTIMFGDGRITYTTEVDKTTLLNYASTEYSNWLLQQ